MVVKAKYLCSMQIDTNWYCNQQTKHHVITVPTRTILHPQLEVDAITEFHAIPTIVCYRTQAKEAISRQPICLTDADYDYILEEIGRREKLILKEKCMCLAAIWRINTGILNEYYMY